MGNNPQSTADIDGDRYIVRPMDDGVNARDLYEVYDRTDRCRIGVPYHFRVYAEEHAIELNNCQGNDDG